MFIFAIILIVVGVVAVGAGAFVKSGLTLVVGGGALIVGLVMGIMSAAYTQDAGEAKVLVDITGNVVGEPDTTEGLGWKAPWVETVTYNIRNQQAIFSNPANISEPTLGGELDFTDKDNVTGKLDIVVRYSIKPDSVEAIYREFGTQASFEASLITPDIRSVTRDAPGQFTTAQVRTQRPELTKALFDALSTRWAKEGVIVDAVNIQDIRYPESVTNAFAEAQNARTKIETATANLKASEISSQEKVVQANAEAEANRVISESLSEEVLKLRGFDALRYAADKGNLIITDGGGTLLNIDAPQTAPAE